MGEKRQLAAALQTVLGVWILVGAILSAPLSYWLSHIGDSGVVAVAIAAEQTKGTAPLGVRSLPLKYDDHVLARYFPGEAPFNERVGAQALYELLDRTELRSAWPALARATVTQPIEQLSDSKPQSAQTYPYRYSMIEPVLQRSLDPEAVRRDPKSVVELSTLVTVFAANQANGYQKFGLLAQALLRRAAEINGTCDVRLNSAFVHSLGAASDDDGVQDLYHHAHEACSDDPTPLYELGIFQVSRSYIEPPIGFLRASPSRSELQERPLSTFRELQAAYPHSSSGYGGEAYAHLALAQRAEAARVQGFSVRMWSERSLEAYERALKLSSDPSLLRGKAQALTALGRHPEAALLYRTLNDADPTNPALQVEMLKALRASGDPGEAAVIDVTMPDPVVPSGFRLRPAADWPRIDDAPGHGLHREVLLDDGAVAGMGGADLIDYEFIPDYRPYVGVDDGYEWVRADAHALDLIVAGRGAEAARFLSSDEYKNFKGGIGPTLEAGVSSTPPASFVLALAAAEVGDLVRRDEILGRVHRSEGNASPLTAFYEERQNLWRAVGDLEKSQNVIEEWLAEIPDDPYGWDRLGEVQFLQGQYRLAAESFHRASRLLQRAGQLTIGSGLLDLSPEETLGRALVKRGLAYESHGAYGPAQKSYEDAEEYSTRPLGERSKTGFYAHSQLGSLCLRLEDFACADEQLEKAVSIGRSQVRHVVLDTRKNLSEPAVQTFMRGAQENNWALAKARLGQGAEATEIARAALAHDPANPIFLDTLAYALSVSGDKTGALDAYRSSLAKDPTNYVARNNLAVLTAQWGAREDARAILQETVINHPRYAMAWFNLGVLLAEKPANLLSSQGALGRAALLDGRLREQAPALQLDHDIYDVGIDVSRPVPVEWEFGESSSRTPVHITGLVVFVVLARIGWILGLDKVTAGLAQWLLRDGDRSDIWRLLLGRKTPSWIGVLATALALGVAALFAGRLLIEAAATMVVIVGALLLLTGIRGLAIPDARHFTWVPALAAMAVFIPLGAPVAPPPCLDTAEQPRAARFRWVGPTVLGAAALGFVAAAVLFGTPLSRVLAIAMLALLATSLLPVPPMDGAYIAQGKKWLNLVITLVIGISTVIFALNWL